MCIGTCKAQTFNFECNNITTIEGTITVTGSPFPFKAYDPNNVSVEYNNTFELTVPGIYTLEVIFPKTIVTKTLTITQTITKTIPWSEI